MARAPKPPPEVRCPYCGQDAVLHLNSSAFYRGRDYGPLWACEPCGAWVGTHKNSPRHYPLGRLADAYLRAAKREVHKVFDPLWQAKMERTGCSATKARDAAYDWLAKELGIEVNKCHMGKFDLETCRRAHEICLRYYKTRDV